MQTLQNELVNHFRYDELFNLKEHLGDDNSVHDSTFEEKKGEKFDENENDSEEDETIDSTKMEIKLLSKLPFVSNLKSNEDQEDLVQWRIKLNLNFNTPKRLMSINIELPPTYPECLPKFEIQETYMIKSEIITQLT